MPGSIVSLQAIGNPREKSLLKAFGGSKTPTHLQHPHDIYSAILHESNPKKCLRHNPHWHRGPDLRCESHKRGFLPGLNLWNNKLRCLLCDSQTFFISVSLCFRHAEIIRLLVCLHPIISSVSIRVDLSVSLANTSCLKFHLLNVVYSAEKSTPVEDQEEKCFCCSLALTEGFCLCAVFLCTVSVHL